MLPEASTSTSVGVLKDAAVPVPFANAAVPEPANTVTNPVGPTLRIRWFTESAT